MEIEKEREITLSSQTREVIFTFSIQDIGIKL